MVPQVRLVNSRVKRERGPVKTERSRSCECASLPNSVPRLKACALLFYFRFGFHGLRTTFHCVDSAIDLLTMASLGLS
jgi:hypothetical protein